MLRQGLKSNGIRIAGIACAIALATVSWPGRSAAQAPFVLQSISVGSHHACGLTAQHVAYCWGRNAEGELGAPSASITCSESGTPCSTKPMRVAGNLAFEVISAGNNYTCAVTTGGAAYCWGLGAFGQLGTGTQASSPRPVKAGIDGVSFQTISAGYNHTCAVTTGGAAYCWGSNAGGKLGVGGSLGGGRTAPAPVAGRLQFRMISAGYYHTCGVTRDGKTYCWGRNEQGEIGNAATSASPTPVRVDDFAGRYILAASQFDYTCAVNQDGALFCWGANCFGQLGVDSTTEQCGTPAMPCSTKPAAIQTAGPFQSVSATFSHTCALTANGAVDCWGENNQGQLANGSTGGRTLTPTPIVGGLSYKLVGTGREFTCALTADGVPQCWGHNEEGQLGVGDILNRNTPTQVVAP